MADTCPACGASKIQTMYSSPLLFRCKGCGHEWSGPGDVVLSYEQYVELCRKRGTTPLPR